MAKVVQGRRVVPSYRPPIGEAPQPRVKQEARPVEGGTPDRPVAGASADDGPRDDPAIVGPVAGQAGALDRKAVGVALKRAIYGLGYSLASASRATGIERTMLSAWCAGRTLPNVVSLMKLRAHIGLDLNGLVDHLRDSAQ